ncbi:polysaccharide pyruvyl transferase family protein [Rhizobium sp. TRM96647]|uniref:polysaccharide pyruvyl transferase family protein n=1 Tax=unclassified Rhizobium TaxID=2613769 RepID=UPI0021E7D452|nr:MULTISPECIES: polysaccharide pyruvyl transferase family protein [unclassified Rhizobium]MCV3736648.1 polysaccharide pyruvyl transferase family protein [Rhizobium sp. TRM96647]MCV3759017.1 polysaccharide pyruvyl transferase family protein [Rhizobium sp. TRM96650]
MAITDTVVGAVRRLVTREPNARPLRPKIGITGSFGRGNYGDELYVKNYQHWFGPWADLYLLTGLPRHSYLQDFGNSFVDMMDAVVLGGGDLLCPYAPKIDRDFINATYLRRPVHIAGIGVERNKPDIHASVLDRWTKFLTHPNIKSISTRDPGSAEWVKEHIQPSLPVGSIPDLVCALPLPKAIKPSGAPIVGLITRHIKDPKNYRIIEEVAATLMAKGWRVRHIIGGVAGHGAKDLENSRHLHVDGKETMHSEELDDISRALGECSLVLSMKLHTTLVAAMYGVPTVCVNPVVKARAFMKAIGREELAINPTDRKLLELIESDVPAPDADRIKILREEASEYMRSLSRRLWKDFLTADPTRRGILPASPRLPV